MVVGIPNSNWNQIFEDVKKREIFKNYVDPAAAAGVWIPTAFDAAFPASSSFIYRFVGTANKKELLLFFEFTIIFLKLCGYLSRCQIPLIWLQTILLLFIYSSIWQSFKFWWNEKRIKCAFFSFFFFLRSLSRNEAFFTLNFFPLPKGKKKMRRMALNFLSRRKQIIRATFFSCILKFLWPACGYSIYKDSGWSNHTPHLSRAACFTCTLQKNKVKKKYREK